MKEILLKSKILECSHSEMQVELINVLSFLKKTTGFEKKDFSQIVLEILDFVGKRCKDEQLLHSYKVFILKKIKLAFDVSLRTKTIILEKDEIENMLDIPIEEFEDAKIDYEYLSELGWEQ
jgi:hypothetical protein